MKVEITDSRGEVMASHVAEDNRVAIASFAKQAYSTNEPYWKSSTSEITAGPNHIALHKVEIKEPVSVKTYDAPLMIGLLFLEKGKVQVRQPEGDFRDITTLQHNLVYHAQQTEETFFAAGQHIRLVIIHLLPAFFFQLAEGGSPAIDRMASNIYTQNQHSFATSRNLQITSPMLRLLSSFDLSVYNTASLRLHTEVKILELLSLQIEQIEDASRRANLSKLNESDVRRLHMAREYLLSDISFTPSMESISMEVGMNVYKLKTGFKALFGQSLFNYLREERLRTAYNEIAKRDRTLTEIAYETGFASISHFSDAFKARYGIAPSQLR